MIGVDIFSGAGGMSVGAQSAGVKVRLAVEIDEYASATYAKNHRRVKVINSPIQQVLHFDLGGADEPIILFGGPPCQGFSTSNQRTRSTENESNWLFREYLRVVGQIRPHWVVFENVRGILETEKGFFLSTISASLREEGYTMSQWVLNAASYGVPQKRSRLFLIGSRQGLRIEPPEPSCEPEVTVDDAIGDLPVLQNGASISSLPYPRPPTSAYARRLRGGRGSCTNHLVTNNASSVLERYIHVPEGGNWSNIPEELMTNYRDRQRCHTGIYRRLRANRPSVVIGNFRKNMLIHPTQERGLSVREAARLQSFPDWFEFEGSIGFQQQQVGNAVPPLLARAVFKRLLKVQEALDRQGSWDEAGKVDES